MKGSRLRHALGWGVAMIGYYCWFQAFYNTLKFGSVFPYRDTFDMLFGICYNFPPIAAVFMINVLIVFHIVEISDLKSKILVDIVLSLVGVLSIGWIFLLTSGIHGGESVDWSGAVLNDIIILMGVEMVYYFNKLSRTRQEAEEVRRQAIQFQYDALKSQINPHFLFNSLNILYSLVSIDSGKSKIFVKELACMYRYIMARQNCMRVKLTEEFDFLKSYVSVLEIRYNNMFHVCITGPFPPDRYIIPFTMQLLIENVIKHNVISNRTPMKVSIKIGIDGIVVSNPIAHREAESVSHIGLRYLKELYAANGGVFEVENDGLTFKAYVPFI